MRKSRERSWVLMSLPCSSFLTSTPATIITGVTIVTTTGTIAVTGTTTTSAITAIVTITGTIAVTSAVTSSSSTMTSLENLRLPLLDRALEPQHLTGSPQPSQG